MRYAHELPLREIKAIFFDLDNTLHDYSKSAGIAMNSVYKQIQKKYAVPTEKLNSKYMQLLKEAEENAFFDGRTSEEYRTERFYKLLGAFNILDESLIGDLLSTYSTTLDENLKPWSSAITLLEKLHLIKPLFLVTEGPNDAQRHTISRLGINKYFTDIFISGEVKKIKETGDLFRYALESSGYEPNEVVLVGDSFERDVQGGMNAGLYVIWFNKNNKKVPQGKRTPHLQISHLKDLETILDSKNWLQDGT